MLPVTLCHHRVVTDTTSTGKNDFGRHEAKPWTSTSTKLR